MNSILAVGALCAALAAIGVALRFLYRSVRSAEDVIREANRVPDLAVAVAALGDRLEYLSNRPLMNGSGDRLIAAVKVVDERTERIDQWISDHSDMHDALAQIPPQWRPSHDSQDNPNL